MVNGRVAGLATRAQAICVQATGALAGLPRWPLVIWLVLVAGGLVARPLLAPGEAQILSIAWEMRLDGAWLPRLNDLPLDGQPPLLFWLIRGAWSLFGVGETAARLVAPLFALGILLLIGPLARLLWPERRQAALLAGILLAGTGGFVAYVSMSLPVLPVTFFAMLGLYGLARVWRGRAAGGWAIYALALGFGFLAGGGGGVALLLAPALAAPLWRAAGTAWGRWLAGLLCAIAGAMVLALLWVVPALMDGASVAALLLTPPPLEVTFGGPPRAAYWMLLALVLTLYPWLLWKTLWRAAGLVFGSTKAGGPARGDPSAWRDAGLRFALVAAASALFFATAISWRDAEGLLPLLPPLALIGARLLDAGGRRSPEFHALLPGMVALLIGLVCFLLNIVPVAHLDAVWREFISERGLPIWLGGISLISGLLLLGGSYVLAQMAPSHLVSRTVQLALMPVLLMSALNLEFWISLRDFFDLSPVAQQIHRLQEAGRPIAIYGAYGGEFGFAGRLEAPLARLPSPAQAIGWAAEHPTGIVVSSFQGGYLRLPARPLYLGQVADNWAALWPAAAVIDTDGAVLRSRF
jgi:4-amino-4-deoxy-L-arabinose transferase-like glycosyltransferase